MFYNWKSELLIWIGVVIYSRGQRAHRLASRWENWLDFQIDHIKNIWSKCTQKHTRLFKLFLESLITKEINYKAAAIITENDVGLVILRLAVNFT